MVENLSVQKTVQLGAGQPPMLMHQTQCIGAPFLKKTALNSALEIVPNLWGLPEKNILLAFFS